MRDSSLAYIAVVHRGEAEIFRLLREHFEGLGLVEVRWDRRSRERRGTRQGPVSERRRRERRGLPPGTWDAYGFVIVPLRGAMRGVVSSAP
jgi:hypothetical protein